jgi:hypothetical protein
VARKTPNRLRELDESSIEKKVFLTFATNQR